jgi:hypothetical protein
MAYYDTDQMLNTLSRAYEGDGQVRAAIRGITLPYAVTDDYSVLILAFVDSVRYTRCKVASTVHVDGHDLVWDEKLLEYDLTR